MPWICSIRIWDWRLRRRATERVPLPMAAAAVQVYEMARAKGQGREDMSSVVKVWEDLTGAKVRGSGK